MLEIEKMSEFDYLCLKLLYLFDFYYFFSFLMCIVYITVPCLIIFRQLVSLGDCLD